jgi:Na+/H+-dicarboxylate symporter
MPVTLTAVEGAGVRPAGARLVVPLGTTLNMNGTALYEAMAALFIAQAYGIVLDPAAQAVVVLLASLAAVGAAGIPEAGLVTMVVVLTTVGLPVEGIGLLLTIDWLLDRFRTTVNVLGDGVAAAVVDAALEGRPSPGAAEDPEPEA